jgi:diguanylate cyclase (GGDEF)-like protein
LRGTIREDDDAFRIGGDEFALILPRTNAAAAFTLIERLFQAARAALPAGPTLSAGISVVAANEPLAGNVDESELRESADAALYEAKRAGRDTAVVLRASSGLADGRQEPHRAA